MKLTAMLLLAAVLQVSAKGTAQTVTYSAKSEPLARVFSVIKEQTGYALFYSKDDLKRLKNVTVDLKDADIQTALEKVLENQPLKYVIEGNTVVISVKKEEKKPSVKEVLNEAPPVKGVVRSTDGQPLAGVNIVVKGTNKGTTTAANGSFEIDAKEGDKLVISSIGYASKEINITTPELITVSLAVSTSPLDEVQIIAYGETSKRLSTGNVSSVKSKDIEKQPVQNPLLAIQGRVPGVFIQQATGLPGSSVTIRVQGQNSLNNGNDPLYVVDGIPYYSQMLPNLSSILGRNGVYQDGRRLSGNPLSFINPADIASIDVLKDADATAIYGSRGANGVILITTKKGKAGSLKVDMNLQKGWGKVSRKMKLLSTQEYLQMRKEAYLNDGLPIPDNTTTPSLNNYDLTVWDQNRFTDWQKVLIGNTAQYDNAQISLSGGTELTQYLLSATYHRETTVFPGDLSDRKGSMNFNVISSSANRKFRFEAGVLYQIDDNNLINEDLTAMALNIAPNAPGLYAEDGTLNWEIYNGVSTWKNPLSFLNNKYDIKTSNLVLNTTLRYEILPGLTVKLPLSYGTLLSTERSISLQSAAAPDIRPFETIVSSLNIGNSSYWQLEPQLNLKKQLSKGVLDAVLGSGLYNSTRKLNGMSGFGFSSDLLAYNISLASNKNILSRPIASIYKYNSVFLNANYNWDNKYIINGNLRRDGSSRFGSSSLFHNFGSIGGAWLISNETFFKELTNVLSFAKIKGSFGTTGNDQIGDYQFIALYNLVNAATPYQGIAALAPDKFDNYYLQWEETKKFSIGIDLGLFKDRILLNANFYKNTSSNQLITYRLPIMTGFSGVLQNFPATIENTGWEFTFNTTNITTKNFNWTSNVNLTIPRNTVTDFPDIELTSYSSGSSGVAIGQPLGVKKVFDFEGVDPVTGLNIYRAVDKQLTHNPDFVLDRTVFVNDVFPEFYGGFNNSLTYKSIRVDFLFQFVKQLGQIYLNGTARPGEFIGSPRISYGNQPDYILNRWQNSGDNKERQKFSTTYMNEARDAYGALSQSEAAYGDASFIRLKNITLSYQLPVGWMSKIGAKSGQLFGSGQNIFTFTGYRGLDPEARTFPATLPSLRVVIIGLNVTF